mmetsp:Transcript_31900/g.49948  ORF Transcript_31900/g.49948 Transcript_31900/m.49948 type:complete len:277 (-) Transcript_31900:101-931(-)
MVVGCLQKEQGGYFLFFFSFFLFPLRCSWISSWISFLSSFQLLSFPLRQRNTQAGRPWPFQRKKKRRQRQKEKDQEKRKRKEREREREREDFGFKESRDSRKEREREREEKDKLKKYYSDLNIIIICFSVKNSFSWQSVMWKHVPEIQENCEKKIPIFLVGCKSHVRNEPQKYSREHWKKGDDYAGRKKGTKYDPHPYKKESGEELAQHLKSQGVVGYWEVSSKTLEGFPQFARDGINFFFGKNVDATYEWMDKEREKLEEGEKRRREGGEQCVVS